MIIAAWFIVTKALKQPLCALTDEWVNRMWGVCIYVCIYTKTYNGVLVIKSEESLLFMTTRMDLEGIILIEIKTDTNTVMISLVYGILKKKNASFLPCWNFCFIIFVSGKYSRREYQFRDDTREISGCMVMFFFYELIIICIDELTL